MYYEQTLETLAAIVNDYLHL